MNSHLVEANLNLLIQVHKIINKLLKNLLSNNYQIVYNKIKSINNNTKQIYVLHQWEVIHQVVLFLAVSKCNNNNNHNLLQII